MKTKKVIGLDISTCTGLSVVGMGKLVHHVEAISFKKLTGCPRIHAIAGRIISCISEHDPEFVVIEDYAVSRFGGSAIVSISIGSVIRFLMWQNEIPYLEVSPTALKKFVTGKGNAKKDQMILEVYKRYGFTSATNDIADAVGLGMFGLCAAGEKFPADATKCVADTMKLREGLALPKFV
jgi:crossover junction endodeoxyribonuclease RuvC